MCQKSVIKFESLSQLKKALKGTVFTICKIISDMKQACYLPRNSFIFLEPYKIYTSDDNWGQANVTSKIVVLKFKISIQTNDAKWMLYHPDNNAWRIISFLLSQFIAHFYPSEVWQNLFWNTRNINIGTNKVSL